MGRKARRPHFNPWESVPVISDLERKLCQRIPTFECLPGCTECCTYGWRLSFNRHGDVVARQDDPPWTCAHVKNGRCGIYDSRPTICRLFFCSEILPPCPKGRGPEKNMTAEETAEFVRIWHWLKYGGADE